MAKSVRCLGRQVAKVVAEADVYIQIGLDMGWLSAQMPCPAGGPEAGASEDLQTLSLKAVVYRFGWLWFAPRSRCGTGS